MFICTNIITELYGFYFYTIIRTLSVFSVGSLLCLVGVIVLPLVVIYCIYSAALFSLIVAVWSVVQFCRLESQLERINELAHRNMVVGRMLDDYVYQTIAFTYISFVSNVLIGIGKGISGWLTQSWMLISLSVYYLFLCFSKFLLLRNSRKLPDQCRREQQEWKAYRVCGTLLMVMTIALLGIVILIVTRNSSFVYNGILIYVVAMVDFYSDSCDCIYGTQ